jgi:GNAT superfamily N-acetyltransferase
VVRNLSEWSIRTATLDDLDRLVELRCEFLTSVGREVDDATRQKLRAYLRRAIPAGDCVFWVAESREGEIVATGAMSVYERMAWSGVTREGYVLSMYTVPVWRNRGIGAAIVADMQRFARDEGLQLCLIALDDARPIYERAGFTDDRRYMRWR